MSIITKRGDEGRTDLLFGDKVEKSSARIEALGAVDELNANLGVVRVYAEEQELIDWIDNVQKNLVNLMGMVATPHGELDKYVEKGYGLITDADVDALEKLAASHEAEGNTFRGWIRPGKDGSLTSAQLHVCRTVCRRAERRCWAVEMEGNLVRIYLNRLADVIFLLASYSR